MTSPIRDFNKPGLVVTIKTYNEDCVILGHDTIIRLLSTNGDQATIQISAPSGVEINRKKLYEKKFLNR